MTRALGVSQRLGGKKTNQVESVGQFSKTMPKKLKTIDTQDTLKIPRSKANSENDKVIKEVVSDQNSES